MDEAVQRILVTAVIAATFIVFVVLASQQDTEARIFPWLLGIPGAIMALVEFRADIRDLRNRNALGDSDEE